MKKIEFEIRGLTYEIEPITIRDYYKIKTDLIVEGREAEFKIISKLSKCPTELLKQLSVDAWSSLSFHFSLMISSALSDNIELVNQFTHEGVEYGLVDWDKMTIGEFADLDVIATSSDADNKLHEILAILYRPIVKKRWKKNIVEEYDYEGFKERCGIFLDLPMDRVKSVIGFFLHLGQVSLNHTKESLEKRKKTSEIQTALKILTAVQEDGGIQSYTFQEGTRWKLTELLNLELKNHSTSLLGNKTKLKNKSWNPKRWLKNIIK